MKKQSIINKSISSWSNILPISILSEQKKYNNSLYQRNLFPYINRNFKGQLYRRTVSFRFRSIEFNKKRALPFFLSIELLTNRKSIASLSTRNIQPWKIRKGRLVGCKVVLRKQALFSFLETLSLAFPRREKYQPRRWTKKIFDTIHIQQKVLKKNISINTSFSLGELVLFHPIELGLGLHPDVQRIEIKFIFNTYTIEERFFLLRTAYIPIINL